MTIDIEKLLTDVRFYQTNKKYGRALKTLEDILEAINADETGNIDYQMQLEAQELQGQVREQSKQAIRESQEKLNSLLQLSAGKPEQYDPDTARTLIEAYSDALLVDSDLNFQNYQQRVQKRIEEKLAYEEFRRVETLVEDEIEKARKRRRDNPNIEPQQLLPYYDEARQIAENAAVANPNNYDLQVLKSKWERERDRIYKETGAITSAALLGNLEMAFEHTRSVPDGELVTVTDENGNPIGAEPKAKALEHLKNLAPKIARNYAEKYRNQAYLYFDAFKPREAMAELQKRSWFEQYLNQEISEQLNKAEQVVQEALDKLIEAEESALPAEQTAKTLGALPAWEQYQAAIQIYQGAEFSTTVKNVRAAILEQANLEVGKREAEITDLYRREQLEEAIDLAERTLTEYSPLGASVTRLRNIDSLLKDVEQRLKKRNELERQLQMISRDIRADVGLQEAKTNLQKLEQEHRTSGLLALEDIKNEFSRLKAELDARLSAEEQLEILSRLLEATNRNRVAEGIKIAETAAEANPVRQDEYLRMADRLHIHLRNLDAKNHEMAGRYDDAIATLKEILQSPQIVLFERSYQDEIQARLQVLERRRATENRNQEILQKAQELLQEGKPKEAYQKLDSQFFGSATHYERTLGQNLQEEAKYAWQEQIKNALRNLNIEAPPNEETLSQYEDDLRVVGVDGRSQYDLIINCYRRVGEALLHVENGEYEEALTNLEEALKNSPSATETRWLNQKIGTLRKTIKQLEKDNLLAELRNATTISPDALSRLEQAKAELTQLATKTRDTIYELWLLEILLALAQYIPDARASRDLFTQAAASANRLRPKLKPQERNSPEMEMLFEIAQRGTAIGKARQGVENQFREDSDIGMFIEAVREWRESFSGLEHEMPYLSRWYETMAEELREKLRNKIHEQDVTVENLETYARLLILNPNDDQGRRLLEKLAGLRASLISETEKLLKGLTSQQDYMPQRGLNLIQKQIQSLQEQQKRLQLTYSIAARFRELLGKESDLVGTSHKERFRIESAIQQMETLLRLAMSFQNYLTEIKNIENEEEKEEAEERWANFLAEVTRLNSEGDAGSYVDFRDHPIIGELEQRKKDAFTVAERLEEVLSRILAMIGHEEYGSELLRLVEKANYEFQINDSPFVRERAKSFYILDPMGGRVQGWDKVRSLAQEKKDLMDRILQWAAPFGIPLTELPQSMVNDIPETETRVVRWLSDDDGTGKKEEADLERMAGNFEDALKIINQALHDGYASDRVLTLEKAYEIIQSPPVALDNAGSERGRRIIRGIQRKYQDALKAAIDDANALLDDFRKKEQAAQNANRDFEKGLQTMAGNEGFWKKRAYREGFRMAEDAMQKFRAICPRSRKVKLMQDTLEGYRR